MHSTLRAVPVPLIAGALLAAAISPAAGAADEGPVEAGIFVDKVEGLSDDFINAMDISSVLSLEESGVVFKDAQGNPADLFEVLADHGVTDVRVRVWNDPYDADGNGYGGGTLDAERATIIADRATEAGMGVIVDFHYADFWAHPGQQPSPKAWVSLSAEDRADALYDFTAQTLQGMLDVGADITMVQVGNETNGGLLAGQSTWSASGPLFAAGAQAVRDTVPTALVAVHFTNPSPSTYAGYAAQLQSAGVDYDVFASSYYPFWHGTLENLTASLAAVADGYDKDVMVIETSWAYTLEDGDGHENSIRTGSDNIDLYPISVQGQAHAYADIMQAVVDTGRGIGIAYWEPAWLPVGPASEASANAVLWEQYGSGWASSFSGEYSADAGTYYGGSSWDNQALFSFDGTPLESLRTFEYAKTGAVTALAIESIESPTVTAIEGQSVVMPATVTATYNDRSTQELAATWSSAVEWIESRGTYTINGVADGGHSISATVVVTAPNVLTNPGFEQGSSNVTPWVFNATPWPSTFWVVASGGNGTGNWAVNAWNAAPYTMSFSQTLSGLEPGEYVLGAMGRGAADFSAELFATTSDATVTQGFNLTNWDTIRYPSLNVTVGESGTLTVGVTGTAAANAWAWFDDFTLTKAGIQGADTTELQTLVNKARNLLRDAYTPESLETVDDALVVADIVLAGSGSSAEKVAEATQLLSDALEALVLGDNVPDPVVTPVSLTVVEGDQVDLPETVQVTFFDASTAEEDVTWSSASQWIDGPGVYTIQGVTSEGRAAVATVTVTARNWLLNPSFEVVELAPWIITGNGAAAVDTGNAADGARAVDFWLGSAYSFEVAQTVTGLEPGWYLLSAVTQGDGEATSDTAVLSLEGVTTMQAPFALNGWQQFATATTDRVRVDESGTLTARATFTLQAEAWGTVDNFRLVRVADPAVDTSALIALVAQAKALDVTGYTPASVAALADAIAAAEVVLASQRPSASSVADVTTLLQGAIDGLEEQVDPVDPEVPAISLSLGTVSQGGTVTVTISGVDAEQVEVGVASTYRALGTVNLTAGAGAATVIIPKDLAPGQHHIQVRSLDGELLAQAPITVRAADVLAFTGADAWGLAAASAMTLMAGLALILIRRRLADATRA